MKKILALMMVCLMSITAAIPVSFGDRNRFGVSGLSGILDVTGKVKNADYNLDSILKDYDYNYFAETGRTDRTVIVELEGKSLVDSYLGKYSGFESVSALAVSSTGVKLAESIRSEQNAFLAVMKDRGISYGFKYQYEGILNGIAVNVQTSDISAIRKIPGVKSVIYSESYARPEADAVSNEVSVYGTGIYDSSDLAYDGSNMVVAILDTGLDYTHKAFQKMPEKARMTSGGVSDVLDKLSASSMYANRFSYLSQKLTAGDVYLNKKVPFAYDYSDNDADVYPMMSSHGTHVAGIIAGEDYEASGKDKNGNDYDFHFSGVATEAQLAIFKVFSDTKDDGAGTEGVLAAVNDATMLGVDVINMSMGSSAGFSRESDEIATNKIYDKVRESGINLVVAAGNSYSSALGGKYGSTNLASNPDSGTVGSPATYGSAISVASISGQLSPYLLANDSTAIYFSNARNASGKEYPFVDELLGGSSQKNFRYIRVGDGQRFNYTDEIIAKLRTGNYIAVVERGTISFEEKQKLAASYGAIACIIYNNVSGLINASLGTGKVIPTCTVSLDMGAVFRQTQEGTITVSKNQLAGPFMSDFSSWGVTPDLKLSPEITAHGGLITSSVLGGYGEFSGTSMACPNLAGATTLLREHVLGKYKDLIGGDVQKRATLVNQLLMSTATIALNEYGNPYSPRKQGAGLANIKNAIDTDAYIYVPNGNKTKLELGDDKAKTGEYTLRFRVNNTSAKTKTYKVNPMTMTETMSTDGITVAERAYMLASGSVRVSANGGEVTGRTLTVKPGSEADVTVVVKLSKAEKEYLDNNFVNGMFVEGFVSLEDQDAGNMVDLTIPWVAFYGDWLAAPMFDESKFDVDESAFDDSVDPEDKLSSALYESVPLGKYYKGLDYYLPLGQYVYNIPDGYAPVQATTDKVAISSNPGAMYELYSYYAGMIRGAKTMHVVISDPVTGEIVYDSVKYNIRKSYGLGSGASTPGPIELEVSAADLNLRSNVRYKVSFKGALDYEGGENVTKNTDEFYFYVDFEVPSIDSYEVRAEYDINKNKSVWLDVSIFDNNYVEALQLFSFSEAGELVYLTDLPIPVYGARNTSTKISINITKYMDNFARNPGQYQNCIGLYASDYAMNGGAYLLPITYGKVDNLSVTDQKGENLRNVELQVGGIQKFEVKVPKNCDPQAVTITPNRTGVVTVQDNVIYASGVGTTTVKVSAINPGTGGSTEYSFTVSVSPRVGEMPVYNVENISIHSYLDAEGVVRQVDNGRMTVPCGSAVTLYSKQKPWYSAKVDVTYESLNTKILDVDRLTGKMTAKKAGAARVQATWKVNGITQSNAIVVTVEEEYTVTGGYLYEYHGIGGDVYIPPNVGANTIGHYREGNPGPFYNNQQIKKVVVPEGVTKIGDNAFAYSSIETIVLPSTLEGIGQRAFYGCKNLKNIIWIDSSSYNDKTESYDSLVTTPRCTARNIYVDAYAFNGCKLLQNFDMTKITTIHSFAFAYCASLTEIDIGALRSAESGIFQYCTSLTSIKMESGSVLGSSMFAGCNKLTVVDYYADTIPAMLFYRCEALRTVNIHNNLMEIGNFAFDYCYQLGAVNFLNSSRVTAIGSYAFEECNALTEFTLPEGLETLGAYAFNSCAALTTVTVSRTATLSKILDVPFQNCTKLADFDIKGVNRNFSIKEATGADGRVYGLLYNSAGDKVVLVPNAYAASGYDLDDLSVIGDNAFANSLINQKVLVVPEGITSIGYKAFMNNQLETIILPKSLESLGAYAFYNCRNLKKVIFLGDKITEIPDYCFYGCSVLEEAELPDSVTKIGANSFRICRGLTYFEIPRNVVTIENSAFEGNNALEKVVFKGNSVKKIGNSAFSSCFALASVELPESLEFLGDSAFFQCEALTSVTVPKNIKEMGGYVFANCVSLSDVVFEEGIEFIGGYMFVWASNDYIYANTSLKNVTIPKSVNFIYPYAFAYCTEIESIEIPGGLLISDNAFINCSGLKNAVLGDTVKYIGNYAFQGTALEHINLGKVELINTCAFYQVKTLKTVDLSSLTGLGAAAFYECTGLTSVSLPKCELIYTMSFYGCKNLTSVSIPAAKTISQGAFFGTGLTEITLPKTLENLEGGVFTSSASLKSFRVEEGNETFFTDGGKAVYRILPNGSYELKSYAPASTGISYQILEGTTRIEEYAFSEALNLFSIEIASTVERIGAYAFYYCGLKNGNIDYNFRSLYAPALETFDSENSAASELYANFTYNFGTIKTRCSYPSNGKGYDNYIFRNWFNVGQLFPEAVEEVTGDILSRIDILSGREITLADSAEITQIGKLFASLSDNQKSLVTNYYKFVEAKDRLSSLQPGTPGDNPGDVVPPSEPGSGTGEYVWLFIAFGAAVAAIIAVGVVYVVKKKKEGK